MGEVEELYQQLQQLRSYLPGLMQLLATFEDGETNRQVFYEVARSVETWRSAAVSFGARYAELKARGAIAGPPKTIASPENVEFDYGFDNFGGNDFGGDDFGGNDFGGNDFGNEYNMGSDMLDEGIGAMDEFLEI